MYQLKALLIVLVSQSLIFNNIVWAAEQLSLPVPDLEAPQVNHTSTEHSVTAGSEHTLTAIVSDNTGIKSVTLYYRSIGDSNYQQTQMLPNTGTDEYAALIENFPESGIEYYIQATDIADNTLLVGHTFSPLIIKSIGVSVALEKPRLTQEKSSESSDSKINWLWIGLGILAVAALAGGGGGGDDDEKASVTVTTKVPGDNP